MIGSLSDLSVQLYADGADIDTVFELAKNPLIRGFTTNPTLMRSAGVTDYEAFARGLLAEGTQHPVSFEVFADDFADMEAQARLIQSWADNVYVKIPVTNTRGESACPLISRLSADGVKVNVTALMTDSQVVDVAAALDRETPAVVSVFAGRIADTGRDPVPLMRRYVEILAARPNAELLWASPRELLNIFHADAAGCHIITVTPDLLRKLDGVGKNLEVFSLETVEMFHRDAQVAGYQLSPRRICAAQ